MNKRVLLLLIVSSIAAGPCGYRRAGTGAGLPEHIRSIAVPAFQNASLRYRVEQRFSRAVMDEILQRARRLRLTSRPEDADAVLSGNITGFDVAGVLLDDTGRTRAFRVTIRISVALRDQRTGKVLFDQPNFTFQGEYELPRGAATLFNEEDPAVDRIAREFAESLMTTILHGL